VSIDTRTLQPGDLFVALKDVRDGHDFVAQALAKGAAAALVSRIPEGVPDAPLLIVPDVLAGADGAGPRGRARARAQGDWGDRIGRQDLDQGNAARGAGSGRAGSMPPRQLQQPLGRAADPGAPAA
jgi:hypothetical protein